MRMQNSHACMCGIPEHGGHGGPARPSCCCFLQCLFMSLEHQRPQTRLVSKPNSPGLRHTRHGGWPAARCGQCLAARVRVWDVPIGHPRGHMQRRERGGAPLEVLHWHPPHGKGGCFARCELAEFSMDRPRVCFYMLLVVSRCILARSDSRVEGLRQ